MSQSTASITLKVHHGDDIRRFSIDKLEWNQVMELLHSTYPTPFTLKYDDADADRVTITNQSDLDDALSCAHNHIVHLYVVDQSPVIAPVTTPTTATATTTTTTATTDAPPTSSDTKSDDLSSQLSNDEMKTILTECLSDPTIITTLPAFLMTFIDTLINNIQTTTPIQTSWNTALSAHPTIRDHVILSVLLPRIQHTLHKADINGMATRVPVQTLQMIKGFIPMLPMFLPSLIPMLTQMMSSDTSSDATVNPLAHLMSQTQVNNNPMANNPMANNPLLSMLGPMFQQLQQSPLANMMNNGATNTNTTTPSTSTSTSTPTPTSTSTPDYSSQLSTLSDLGVGSPELNLSLLKQWNGDVEKVLEFLSAME